jgi:Domain of unknown function (DUF4156)/Short C-terminal domain
MHRPTHVPLGVALTLAACAPPLTPAGQQVRVMTTRPFGCTELGILHGPGDSVDHAAPEDAATGSHSAMRNEAAEMGANYVWLVDPDVLGATVSARAFRCDATPTPAPNLGTAPGAAHDPEARLQKLKDLFDKGVITREEYDRQRAAILQSF